MSDLSYLAFEVNVLSRIEFNSLAMPFSSRPELGLALKRRGKRVTANHFLRSAWNQNLAFIQNNTERLSENDVNAVLEDAYVPGHQLKNSTLRNWFGETDSWWFENVRRNIDRLGSSYLFSIAASIAMQVGDYVMSFDDRTRELRQPLSSVYKRLWEILPSPINNSQNNSCMNKSANEFLAETFADLLFLRIPPCNSEMSRSERWREEWLRGGNGFWDDVNASQSGKLGSTTQTRSQLLRSLEETLSIGSNIKHWAVAHSEGGMVTTQDIVDVVNKLRRVDKIYSKDFSELAGVKAAIITA